MQQFFRSLASLIVGMAMTLFGLFQGIQLLPAAPAWHAVVLAAPQLLGVLLFVLCLAGCIVGLVMLVRGARTMRLIWLHARRLDHAAMSYGHEPEPWQ